MNHCGLYIHTPFCETKCGYCDFYSVALKDRPTAPLVRALETELRRRVVGTPMRISTVFVGGGTPTLLPPGDLNALFGLLAELLDGHPVTEFTVEANPATVDAQKLRILTAAGVDRISMGAQSWHEAELATLERLHSPADIAPGVELIRRHGVKRLNLDLIFGIPGQTMESWSQSLDRTMALGVDHISCYGLTYEPATKLTAQLKAGSITPCDEEIEAAMYLNAIDALQAAGYEQYEISNFAQPGQECRHNLIYWRNEPYIGVGPSAAGYIGGRRYKNIADVGGYVRGMRDEGHAEAESEHIIGPALAGETIMMQLRLNEGVDLDALRRRTGIDPLDTMHMSLERHRAAGLVTIDGARLKLTRTGRLVSDAIIADFFAEIGRDAEKVTHGVRPNRT